MKIGDSSGFRNLVGIEITVRIIASIVILL